MTPNRPLADWAARLVNRRRFLSGTAQAAGLLLLAGCDNLSRADWFTGLLHRTEGLTQKAQRALTPSQGLAREYTDADISPVFPANGESNPMSLAYQELAQNGFAGWALEVDGLVERPSRFTLADLRALPVRTQITRHDCVEGWSAIAKWTGAPLAEILDRVRPTAGARYVVFHCADPDDEGQTYYESIDLDNARHPQTLLAYEMNDRTLPVAHGAPIRLRVERQLGYKQAKYVMRLEFVASFADIAGGKGGYWEDQGYEWYAGI